MNAVMNFQGSVIFEEVIDLLKTCQLFRKDSAARS